MQDIQSWITESLLDATVNDKIVTVNGIGNFLIIEEKLFVVERERAIEVVPSYFESFAGDKFERLFDDSFRLILSDDEVELVSDESVDIKYFLFQFGDRWYYCDDWEIPVLNEFKYLGFAKRELDTKFPFLGIHGGYDLCNGSRLYEDWCKKSIFLGINTLGIAEENTLAGTLDFQDACKGAGIKSIIGETITVKGKSNYTLKLYVQNEIGWKNLLRVNAEINVHNDHFITEDKLKTLEQGLICVIPPDSLDAVIGGLWNVSFIDRMYFQFDLCEWDNQERDIKWLGWIKNYLDNYYDKIPLLLISDAYYLDKSDADIRRKLNKIGNVKFKYNSKNQWFKSLDEIFTEISELFNDEDARLFEIIENGTENLNAICDAIDFKIEVGKLKLPKYKMTKAEFAKYNGDSKEMILDLIGQGFEKKLAGKVDEELYLERISEELEVISSGSLEDYFLILWDIIKWCGENDIWVGTGRGSAAGSMISYCLNIVTIDPIKYDLIFARFLNAGRVGKSLPDIDTDFEGARRDDVKRYIEQRYGEEYVTSIGTYSTMKLRGAIGDLARCASIASSKTKFVTSFLNSEASFSDLFTIHAKENSHVKEYIIKNPKVIDSLPACLNQPKTSSVHAAGVVIVPEEYGTIYEQMPVKKMDGLLVSEWEGDHIDKAGFLKCDILGVKQLDKFSAISKLIEKTTGNKILFDDIDLDNEEVFKLFKAGYNNDVFQFGTSGLKGYCKKLQPDTIEDLIAAVSLYRPGAMETGGHEKYIRVKNGIESAFYWFGCESITKNTYGIFVYQEQIMRVVQEIGGFTLVEADDIRKAMGKKIQELLDSYKNKFVAGAVVNGCSEEEAVSLWEMMETFAGYGFNRSHAACYAIMGYYSQWYKSNYPLEFYTVALQFADSKEEKIELVAEINKAFPHIKISPPDINNSISSFVPNTEKNTIYWSMTVKFAGEVAINAIQQERTENGLFFSLEEFVERTNKYSAINIRVIKNLIISGAFDEVERITDVRDRYGLLKWYYDYRKTEFPDDINGCKGWKEHKWTMYQLALSGCGYINFEKIISGSKVFAAKQDKYKHITDLLIYDVMDSEHVTSGVLVDAIERPSRNGKFVQLEIQDNADSIYVTVWNDVYEPIKGIVRDKIGGIVILSGKLIFDTYKNKNGIQSNRNTKIEFV